MSVVGGPRPLDDGAVNDSSDSALALAATAPFEDFQQASDAVLALLQSRFPMGLWMVTRTVEDDWVVLQASDRSYGVTGGDHFRWSDSFCYRMVRGEGPNVAADSSSVPAYAQAPIGRDIPIAAYIGYPLLADGQLFGTLCAIDPQVRPDRSDDEPLIRLLARLLSTVLESQLHATQLSEMAAELMDSAHRDPLTRLLNRRGWERLVTQAQENLTMLGIRQCVVIVDLDGLKNLNDTAGHAAGDDVLQRTAAALGGSTRGADVVARIGGDEFAILLEEPDALEPAQFVQRLEAALVDADVAASVGWSVSGTGVSVAEAVAQADARMYEQKRLRRGL
ncbi:MAG TPA: sensor domain-containing diguanylate cyclase [Actinomycetota bacterium]|nr:sensor domain-containing diguanylate cyclase [Micrococcales bacterium]HPQ83913.1 sensor domain-containing diguanylate cyclase [Actinomycetota bacterium]HRV66595.1 sensor domain-containing diguanylate cyclase [Candidatus Nanopelagicales bacterium]